MADRARTKVQLRWGDETVWRDIEQPTIEEAEYAWKRLVAKYGPAAPPKPEFREVDA